MKTIGIKLADGTFYPILEEGSAQEKILDLTTAHNNQTTVMVAGGYWCQKGSRLCQSTP